MTNRLSTLLMVSAATLLASCSSGLTCGNSHPYASYNPAAPLKAPAGVTVPAPDPAYMVPAAGTTAKATPAPAAGTNGAQPCLVTPPNVLTKTDMARPTKAPASSTKPKPAAVPAATTHGAASPAPAVSTRAAPAVATQAPAVPASHPKPVAASGGME